MSQIDDAAMHATSIVFDNWKQKHYFKFISSKRKKTALHCLLRLFKTQLFKENIQLNLTNSCQPCLLVSRTQKHSRDILNTVIVIIVWAVQSAPVLHMSEMCSLCSESKHSFMLTGQRQYVKCRICTLIKFIQNELATLTSSFFFNLKQLVIDYL